TAIAFVLLRFLVDSKDHAVAVSRPDDTPFTSGNSYTTPVDATGAALACLGMAKVHVASCSDSFR
ncbi:hypothetical protein, partial [Actinomadura fulvescens]|uniref:hypothetical protein n=1 Tax=Actinomadura fulvescens TaxID=46160 RepID=UPI0031DF7CF9